MNVLLADRQQETMDANLARLVRLSKRVACKMHSIQHATFNMHHASCKNIHSNAYSLAYLTFSCIRVWPRVAAHASQELFLCPAGSGPETQVLLDPWDCLWTFCVQDSQLLHEGWDGSIALSRRTWLSLRHFMYSA
jgi:hypothetical protein